MRPGDLVRYYKTPGCAPVVILGIVLSSRTTKWDRKIRFLTLLTPEGVTEIIDRSCEVIS